MTIVKPEAPTTPPTAHDQHSHSTTPDQGTARPAGEPRRWVRRILGGGQLTEQCPAFCAGNHSDDQGHMLDDLCHDSGPDVELTVDVFDHWDGDRPATAPLPILRASIRVDPYSDNPRRRVPFVVFEPAADDVMDELDPDALAAVIAQVRAHCDRLDQVHAQLIAARAEYGVTGGTR